MEGEGLEDFRDGGRVTADADGEGNFVADIRPGLVVDLLGNGHLVVREIEVDEAIFGRFETAIVGSRRPVVAGYRRGRAGVALGFESSVRHRRDVRCQRLEGRIDLFGAQGAGKGNRDVACHVMGEVDVDRVVDRVLDPVAADEEGRATGHPHHDHHRLEEGDLDVP